MTHTTSQATRTNGAPGSTASPKTRTDAQATTSGKHTPPTEPDELRQEIGDLRSDLGDAVEELADKVDVKARAQKKIEHGKEVAVQRKRQVGEFYQRHQPWSNRVVAAGVALLAGIAAITGVVLRRRAAQRNTFRGRMVNSRPGKAASRNARIAQKRAQVAAHEAAVRVRAVGKDAGKRAAKARKKAAKKGWGR